MATPQTAHEADQADTAAAGDHHEDHDVLELVTAIEREQRAVPDLSVAALRGVLNGIITGEGPTAAGRVHFTRTLDRADAALCARIVGNAGGAAGLPVSRGEADVLFEIDAASAERTDGGRFADLFVKAVAHCALSQAGHPVPPRQQALARHVALSSWANRSTGVNGAVLAWIAARVNHRRRPPATLADLAGFLSTVGAAAPFTPALPDLS